MKTVTPLMLLALLSCSAVFANATRALKIQIVEDPTSPKFTYSVAGGGKKWAYASEKAVYEADNKDKKSKDRKSELVKIESSALSIGKLPVATATVANVQTANAAGDPVITSRARAVATDAFGKPKVSHADVKVSTFDTLSQTFKGEGNVVQSNTGVATAEQTEKKDRSAVTARVQNVFSEDPTGDGLKTTTATTVEKPGKFIEREPNAKTFEDSTSKMIVITEDGEEIEVEKP